MKIIGITGRSGSGKSAVSALYRRLGYTVADADLVARQRAKEARDAAPR